MGRLKRKRTDRGLQRIFDVDTVSAREVVEVAQKIRDARPHTKVMIMTEDELKETAHRTFDGVVEKTAHDYREITGTWMLCACVLYWYRYEHLGARAIVNRLEKMTAIAHDLDTSYQFIDDLVAAVFEETGVNLV